MDVRTLLRAALVPLGLAIAARGIEDLRTEADELRQLVDERRAYLAGDGPLPDDDEHQDVAGDPEPAAAAVGTTVGTNSSFAAPARQLVAGVAGLAAGVLVGRLVGRWARRATVAALTRDELAAYGRGQAAVTRAMTHPLAGDEPTAGDRVAAGDLPAGDEHEHQDVDKQPPRNSCPDCPHVAAGPLALTLHRQQHAAGLPGR